MLLLTMNEWLGPGRKMSLEESSQTKAFESKIALATRSTLTEALKHIHQYELAFNENYRLAVNFKLLSVSTIDDVNDESLADVDVAIVENLPQKSEDFDT